MVLLSCAAQVGKRPWRWGGRQTSARPGPDLTCMPLLWASVSSPVRWAACLPHGVRRIWKAPEAVQHRRRAVTDRRQYTPKPHSPKENASTAQRLRLLGRSSCIGGKSLTWESGVWPWPSQPLPRLGLQDALYPVWASVFRAWRSRAGLGQVVLHRRRTTRDKVSGGRWAEGQQCWTPCGAQGSPALFCMSRQIHGCKKLNYLSQNQALF